MPTVLQYRIALETLEERGLDAKKREMLRAHWASPGHVTTATLLARHVGYSHLGIVNMHYGKLGSMIAEAGGFAVPFPALKLSALATWDVDAPDGSGHFALRMRPELVKALKQLGWHMGATAPKEPSSVEEYLEGEARRIFITIRHRERRARQAKIREALAQSPNGRLVCEVPGCGFDFESAYGDRGQGYAEVHHTNPMAARSGNQPTRLDDLVIICANCHAIVHRYGETLPLGRVIARARRKRVSGVALVDKR